MADNRDIRSTDDYEPQPVVGSERDNLDWASDLPDPSTLPSQVEYQGRVGMEDESGKALINPATGQPFGMRTSIQQNLSDPKKLWELKRDLQPCFLCEHFRIGAFTREQKVNLWKALAKEHGWSEKSLKGGLGNPDNFELCEAYGYLTHRSASCPRFFKPKKTLLRMSLR